MQDWKKCNPDQAEKYFKLAQKALEDIKAHGSWTAEHKQIERMLMRSIDKFNDIYGPRISLTFSSTRTADDYSADVFNIKFEYPILKGHLRFIFENEIKKVMDNWAYQPILATAGHIGQYEYGSLDVGLGWALGDATDAESFFRKDIKLDATYNFRNMLSVTGSWRYLEAAGREMHAGYVGASIRPALLLGLISRDHWYIMPSPMYWPVLKGLSFGVGNVFFADYANDRHGYLVNLNVGWEQKLFLEWLGVSTNVTIPVHGQYIQGVLNPGELDTVEADAPIGFGLSLQFDPAIWGAHLTGSFFLNYQFVDGAIYSRTLGGQLGVSW